MIKSSSSSSIKWKISNVEGEKMIHDSIKHILSQNNNIMLLNDLADKLNKLDVNINESRRYNKLLKYIKCNYRGIKNFLDSYDIYGLEFNNNNIMVHLLNNNSTYNIINMNDWVLL